MKQLAILFFFVTLMFNHDVLSQDSCVDENLIDVFTVCFDLWDPVCGCDGVTYSNECYAINFAGVTSFTEGTCENIEEVFPCDDLVEVDFGLCDMVLGIAMVNGECSFLSGCGWEVNGVDYSPAFYDSIDACNAACGDNGAGCYTDDGEFYELGQVLEVSEDGCENYTCSAVGPAGIYFEFILNADLYPWECDPIWEDGCYADDGAFYLPGEVLEVSDDWCENYTCIAGFAGFMFILNSDLYPMECEIDPNLGCFEEGEYFPVGAAYYLNDCEYIVCEGNMDWSEVMLVDDCDTNDCIDPTLIDLDVACYDLWDPVCGCDGVTYSNDCYAVNYAGVTSFTPGPCNDIPGGCTYIQALNYQPDASWDDGSCLFAPCNSDCTGDVDGDSSVTVNDILQLLGNFGAICQ